MKQTVIALLLTLPVFAAPAQHNRVTSRVDNTRRATLRGHVHPLALAENDQGRADASLQIPRVTLVLRPSDAQQADLDQLLASQQDPTSPNYHKWLTPEEYAD